MSDTYPPLEQCEIAAFAGFFEAAPDTVRQALGIGTHRIGQALVCRAPATDVLALNRVVGLGTFTPAEEADLDSVVELFRGSGAPRMFIQIHPGARPPEIAWWLGDRGIRPYNHWFKLYHTLRFVPEGSTELAIREIGVENALDFGTIVATSFEWPREAAYWVGATVGRPGWRHFMAFDGNTPVATGAFFVDGQDAWLDFAATLASHRNRGAQSALIRIRLEEVKRLGCRRAQVETSEPKREKIAQSLENARRFGFQVAYRRANYLLSRSS